MIQSLQIWFLTQSCTCYRGSGLDTYEKGKIALHNWRHFGLEWAFVDSKTPIQIGVKFCACVQEFFPSCDASSGGVCKREKENYKVGASFGFGSGILQGQLLGGEEHFSIELDENNQVWKPRVVLVLANDTAYELAARVLHQEHHLYVEVAEALCEEQIVWKEYWCPAHNEQSKPQ